MQWLSLMTGFEDNGSSQVDMIGYVDYHQLTCELVEPIIEPFYGS